MAQKDDLTYLRVALVLVGLIFLVGVYPLMIIWPSGWTWHTGHSDYPMMIVGIYATLGVFLILAARDPLAHLSVIWFTVWSSLYVQSSSPVLESNARNLRSVVAPIKTRPPALTIGPALPLPPTFCFSGASPSFNPSTETQAISPVFALTAQSRPHGGF